MRLTIVLLFKQGNLNWCCVNMVFMFPVCQFVVAYQINPAPLILRERLLNSNIQNWISAPIVKSQGEK